MGRSGPQSTDVTLSNPYPQLGDHVGLRVRVQDSLGVEAVYVRSLRDGDQSFAPCRKVRRPRRLRAAPLVMGFIQGRTGSYGLGLALLAAVAAATLVLTLTLVRSAARDRAAESIPARRAPGGRRSRA